MGILVASAVLLLIASSATCKPPDSGNVFGPQTMPKLDAPSNMLVGHESETSVWLTWDFGWTESLALGNVTFGITLIYEGRIVKSFEYRPVETPFRFRFSDLKPLSSYDVEIYAHSKYYKNSTRVSTDFLTMPYDWPSPKIVKTYPKEMANQFDYHVLWQLPVPLRSPSFFEVKGCRADETCKIWRTPESQLSVKVSMRLEYELTFTVAAIYEVPVVGTIRRRSKEIAMVKALPAPSSVYERSEEQIYCESVVEPEKASCRYPETDGFEELLRRRPRIDDGREIPSLPATKAEWEAYAFKDKVAVHVSTVAVGLLIVGLWIFVLVYVAKFLESMNVIERRLNARPMNGANGVRLEMRPMPPQQQPPPEPQPVQQQQPQPGQQQQPQPAQQASPPPSPSPSTSSQSSTSTSSSSEPANAPAQSYNLRPRAPKP